MGTSNQDLVRLAEFAGKEEYEHFINPNYEQCFACNSQRMLVKPLEVNTRFVLLEATYRLEDGFAVMPGCWLVYPREHVSSLQQMPPHWTESVQHAARIVGVFDSFNTSENWGRAAGQTVSHAHTWIVQRGEGETGLLSQGTGLATIVQHIKTLGIPAE